MTERIEIDKLTPDSPETMPPAVRAQIERAMGDPMRMMPSERMALEAMGFQARVPR